MSEPLIIAHRGARADAPENTLPAFQEAQNQAADGIELDVTLSADGHIIVIHDDTLERTTTGTGDVSRLTLEQIKVADAGLPFAPEYEGTRIPTLDEVLDSFGHAFTVINVELKGVNPGKSVLPGDVLTCIKTHKPTAQILISSFNPFLLRQVNRVAPRGLVRIGYLTTESNWTRALQNTMAPLIGTIDARHPHYTTVNAGTIRWAQTHSIDINVWTVNNADDIRAMANIGVHGIITDKPAIARQIIQGE